MRLRTRLVAPIVVAAVVAGATACSAASARPGPRTASPPAASAAPRPAPSPSVHPAIAVAGAPAGVKAKGAILVDAATGQVLWSRDAQTMRPMASVTKVNAAAARMGLTRTRFTNPDGLPYPSETSTYSTPSDLVTLGLAAMRYPAFRSLVDLEFYHLPKGPGHHQYWWDNTDGLIGSYPGADGIKTGYTDDAGHCLLFEAVRGGRTLIGAVLDSPATGPDAAAQDAARMLTWGFRLPPLRS